MSLTLLIKIKSRISPLIFKKILNSPYGILRGRGQGATDSGKKIWWQNSHVRPFNKIWRKKIIPQNFYLLSPVSLTPLKSVYDIADKHSFANICKVLRKFVTVVMGCWGAQGKLSWKNLKLKILCQTSFKLTKLIFYKYQCFLNLGKTHRHMFLKVKFKTNQCY